MGRYSMAELAARVGKTEQRVRTILKKNYSELYLNHRIEEKNTGRVYYDGEVLEALLKHYDITEPAKETEKKETIADGVGVEEKENGNQDIPNIYPPPPDVEAAQDSNIGRLIDILQQQLEDEKQRNADLEKQLHDKEMERLHFISENAKLTNLLAAEREQIKLLLPPPKITFRERIKALFKKDKGAGADEGNKGIE